eukprot:906261-Pyramimonas_sp.AAC.1
MCIRDRSSSYWQREQGQDQARPVFFCDGVLSGQNNQCSKCRCSVNVYKPKQKPGDQSDNVSGNHLFVVSDGGGGKGGQGKGKDASPAEIKAMLAKE